MTTNRQQYITALKMVLSAREDFKDLTYHRDKTGNKEYLFLTDLIGHVFMLDVTGFSEHEIFHELAVGECGTVPNCCIQDTRRMMEIAKLFA